jgi:hypothetical protein
MIGLPFCSSPTGILFARSQQQGGVLRASLSCDRPPRVIVKELDFHKNSERFLDVVRT